MTRLQLVVPCKSHDILYKNRSPVNVVERFVFLFCVIIFADSLKAVNRR